MDKKISMKRVLIFCLMVTVMFSLCLVNTAFSKDNLDDNDPHMTGLPELTQEEIEWQKEHVKHVKKVNMNKLGLKRVNRWRKVQGLHELTKDTANVMTLGQEIEGETGDPPALNNTKKTEVDEEKPLSEIPPYVDNSSLKYFPPIRSQGSLPSCGCFSGTYYAMTYMYAFANDLDAKNGGDNYRLSPKWTYNMVNNGETDGSWYYWAYEIGQKHGVSTWEEFPYDSDYRAWSLNTNVWENAIYRRFDQYGYVVNTNLDSGIEQVKQLLLNGYILNIATYIYSWQYMSIGDDPATPDDDPFVGKSCCYWVNGTSGYHAMTVVGYNDDIWVDINSNGYVDAGEKGAFRIANSWGTGWKEGGFCWMAYDALRNPSAVQDGPSTNRVYGWSPARAYWVTARTAYEPMYIAEFNISHLKRNQLRITLGISDIQADTPETIWYPEMISLQGGPYAFDGTTVECDGTFVFDFSDILISGATQKRYYIGIYDSLNGNTATLNGYTLIDLFNGVTETVDTGLPITADGDQEYAYIDYIFDNGNISPVAFVLASPLSGTAPLSVEFSGADSYDPDGIIVTYEWDFADGRTGSGITIEHTYENPGTYVAKLKVVDNMGGVGEDYITIEVQQDQSKVIHVEQIDMSVITLPGGVAVEAAVMVKDLYGNPSANATVTVEWGGLLKGVMSVNTDSDGIVMFTSKKTRDTGVATLQVTNVTSAGYTYDENQNIETYDSISINFQ